MGLRPTGGKEPGGKGRKLFWPPRASPLPEPEAPGSPGWLRVGWGAGRDCTRGQVTCSAFKGPSGLCGGPAGVKQEVGGHGGLPRTGDSWTQMASEQEVRRDRNRGQGPNHLFPRSLVVEGHLSSRPRLCSRSACPPSRERPGSALRPGSPSITGASGNGSHDLINTEPTLWTEPCGRRASSCISLKLPHPVRVRPVLQMGSLRLGGEGSSAWSVGGARPEVR